MTFALPVLSQCIEVHWNLFIRSAAALLFQAQAHRILGDVVTADLKDNLFGVFIKHGYFCFFEPTGSLEF